MRLGSQMKCEGRKQKYPGSDQFSENCDLRGMDSVQASKHICKAKLIGYFSQDTRFEN